MKKERKAGLVLNYDNVLDYLGQFGCFQRRVFLCMCLVSFLTGPPTVIFAFTGETPLPSPERLFIFLCCNCSKATS